MVVVGQCRNLLRAVVLRTICTALALAVLPPAMIHARLASVHVPSGAPEHLIVVPSVLLAEAIQLRDHRSMMGTPSAIATIEDILAQAPASQSPARSIRDYIRHVYGLGSLRFVLLYGDDEYVPIAYALSSLRPHGGHTEIPADLYYGCLDGDWDADGDGILAEADYIGGFDQADLTPELAVGRLPAASSAEASVINSKIIAFELNVSARPIHSVLGSGEVVFPQNWDGVEQVYLDGAALIDSTLSAAATCQSTATAFGLDRQYENHSGYPGSTSESVSTTLTALETVDYGYWMHIGHGHYYNVSLGDGSAGLTDIRQLRQSGKTFVALSVNCAAVALDVESLFKELIRLDEGGAVACFGTSRSAFPSPAARAQNAMLEAALCASGEATLGDMLLAGFGAIDDDLSWENLERWTTLSLVLLGDPGMRVWNSDPRTATVTTPGSLDAGAGTCTVSVVDSATQSPIVGITVVVSLPTGETQAVTDVNGQAQVPYVGSSGDTASVWVSGASILPIETAVPVIGAQSASVVLSTAQFVDSGSSPIIGNGNGLVDAGETIGITVNCEAFGAGFAGGSLLVGSPDPHVSIVTGSVVVPAIAGGQSIQAPNVELSISQSTPDGHLAALQFMLLETGGGASYTSDTSLEVHAPEFVIASCTVDDVVGGNGNGILEAGENVGLVFTVGNIGSGDVQQLDGVLSSQDPSVTISDGLGTWSSIPGLGGQATNSLDVFAVSTTDLAAAVELEVTSGLGAVATLAMDLQTPSSPQNLTVASSSVELIQLRWDPAIDGITTGYLVERRSGGGGAWEPMNAEPLAGSASYEDAEVDASSSYEFRVIAVGSNGFISNASPTVAATTGLPELDCFPIPIGAPTAGSVLVADVDGDHRNEVLLGADHLYMLRADCSEELNGDFDLQTIGPVTAEWGQYAPSSVAASDLIPSSPGLEIVVSRWDDPKLYVFDSNGIAVPGWPVNLMDHAWSTPVIGDIDGDGLNEVVINDTRGWTYAFNSDGSEVCDGDSDVATTGPLGPRRERIGEPGIYESYGRTTPALLDVDGDGAAEVLFGTKYGEKLDDRQERFHALKGDGSGDALGWPKSFSAADGASFVSSPTVADIDSDGVEEILALSEGDKLYAWEKDGTTVMGFPYTFVSNARDISGQAPNIAVGELLGSGLGLQMVVVEVVSTTLSRVNIVESDGQLLPGWPVSVPTGTEASPVIADITGDGSLDVLLGVGGYLTDGPNALYAWHSDGQPIAGFPMQLAGPVRSAPTVCDFNGDGLTNIVLAAYDQKLHVWNTGVIHDPGRVGWPTFRGGVERTGVYDDPRLSIQGPPVGELFLSSSESARVGSVAGVQLYQPFSFYLRADLDFTDIGRPEWNGVSGLSSWEGSVSVPQGITVISTELVPSTSLDLGGSSQFIVGTGSPVLGSTSPQTLVKFSAILIAQLQDAQIRIGPAPSGSGWSESTGATPGWAGHQTPADTYPFASIWAESTLVVNPTGGTIAPTLVQCSQLDGNTMAVVFDRQMEAVSTEVATSYVISLLSDPQQTFDVGSATVLPDGNIVRLEMLNPVPENTPLRLSVTGPRDVSGDPVAAGSEIEILSASMADRLIISEIMCNPVAVADTDGEWFELHNPGRTAVPLAGYIIESAAGESHQISLSSDAIVSPGAYRVLARNGAAMLDQGVDVLYEYGSGIDLDDVADELRIKRPSGDLVDQVDLRRLGRLVPFAGGEHAMAVWTKQ